MFAEHNPVLTGIIDIDVVRARGRRESTPWKLVMVSAARRREGECSSPSYRREKSPEPAPDSAISSNLDGKGARLRVIHLERVTVGRHRAGDNSPVKDNSAPDAIPSGAEIPVFSDHKCVLRGRRMESAARRKRERPVHGGRRQRRYALLTHILIPQSGQGDKIAHRAEINVIVLRIHAVPPPRVFGCRTGRS